MSIEKYISPFIQSHFPEFYREYGPNFIAFVSAYYEWMESTGNPIDQARSLYDYADIDNTLDTFVKYFKNKYMLSIPQSTLADQRLLMKHILDLYKSKGSLRAYELLFRILFNEDIQVYVPGNDLFRLSNNKFVKPVYLELSDSQYFQELIGRTIKTASGSTAIVDNYYKKLINNEIINVVVLSSVSGAFRNGDRIFSDDLYIDDRGNKLNLYEYNRLPELEKQDYSLALTTDNAPYIVGSLSSIAILNGGAGFSVGDILDVQADGSAGKARVAAVRDENGKVTFTLVDGGSGFSMNPTIRVVGGGAQTTINLSSDVWTSTYLRAFNGSNTLILTSSNGTQANSVTNTFVASILANLNVDDSIRLGNGSIGTQYMKIMAKGSPSLRILLPIVANTITDNGLYVGDSITNTSLGISNLTIDTINGSAIYLYGSDIMNANLTVGTKLISNTTNTVISLYSKSTNTSIITASISCQDPYSLLTDYNSANNGNNIIKIKGGGTGASFKVGGLIDKEVYTINTDKIKNFLGVQLDLLASGCNVAYTGLTGTFTSGDTVRSNTTGVNTRPIDVSFVVDKGLNLGEKLSNSTLGIANLVTFRVDGSLVYTHGADITNANLTYGTTLISNTTNTIVSVINLLPVQNTYGNGTITQVTGNTITIQGIPDFGYFVPGYPIYGSNSAIATATAITRNTDWTGFTKASIYKDNLDQQILNALNIYDIEVGTITYLTQINPGAGYTTPPAVSIVQEDIYDLRIHDRSGYKGFNAIISTDAGDASGVVTAVDVYDSGFGYSALTAANLVSTNTENRTIVSSRLVVDSQGYGSGGFNSRSGFLSDTQHVIDSNYWQMQSYDIIAPRMISSYEKLVRDLVHPAGIALFGTFAFRSQLQNDKATSVYFSESNVTVNTVSITLNSNTTWSNTFMLVSPNSRVGQIYSSNGTSGTANSTTNTYVNSLLANIQIYDVIRVGNTSIGTKYLTVLSKTAATTNSSVTTANIIFGNTYVLSTAYNTKDPGNANTITINRPSA